jgi:phage shock protein C
VRKLANKKLYRDNENAVFAGVCKGLADHLDMDVSVVRLIFVLVAIFTTGIPVLLIYIIMALVVPTKTSLKHEKKDSFTVNQDEYDIDEDEFTIDEDEYYK